VVGREEVEQAREAHQHLLQTGFPPVILTV
jgi:hypothetical protein